MSRNSTKKGSVLTLSEVEEKIPYIDDGIDDGFIPEQTEERRLIEIERDLLEKKITEEFSPEFVKILRRISYYVGKVGLTITDACLLVRIDATDFGKKVESYPMLKELIALKELEYKADLLSTVSDKARQGNDKLATWLLSAKYGDEFNKRKGTGSPDDPAQNDLIAMGIEFIQKNGDNNSLVSEKSGRAFIVKRTSSDTGESKNILNKLSSLLK